MVEGSNLVASHNGGSKFIQKLNKLHIFVFSEKPHELDVQRFSAHNTTCGNDTFPRGFGQKVNTGVNSIKQTNSCIKYMIMDKTAEFSPELQQFYRIDPRQNISSTNPKL